MHPHAIASGRVYWLLDLVWAGRTWRFAEDHIEVGGVPYLSGLGRPTVSDDSPPGSAIAFRSVSLTLLFSEDVAALVERGYDLRTATGTLYRWVDGYPREAVVSGRATTPTYGPPGRPVTLTLEGGPWVQERAWPPVSHVVSTETFDNPDDKALGKVYPQVYGRPGSLDRGIVNAKGSPGLVVQATGAARLMIAEGPVEATTVMVTDDAVGTYHALPVLYDTDNRGVVYAYVALTSSPAYVTGHSYYVAWGDATYDFSAALGTMRKPIRTARQVLVEVLSKTAPGCDVGKTLSAPGLDIPLDFYVDEVVDPWEWVKAHILPILPISIWTGPQGSYPVVWRYNAKATDVEAIIDTSQGCSRIGGVAYPSDRAVSEVSLEYAIDAGSGEYQRSIVVTGNPDGSGHTTRLARVAWSRGEEGSVALKSDVIQDDGTAFDVVAGILARRAIPMRRVRYALPLEAEVKPGTVVAVTDPEMSWLGKLGLVEDPVLEGGYRTARIAIL